MAARNVKDPYGNVYTVDDATGNVWTDSGDGVTFQGNYNKSNVFDFLKPPPPPAAAPAAAPVAPPPAPVAAPAASPAAPPAAPPAPAAAPESKWLTGTNPLLTSTEGAGYYDESGFQSTDQYGGVRQGLNNPSTWEPYAKALGFKGDIWGFGGYDSEGGTITDYSQDFKNFIKQKQAQGYNFVIDKDTVDARKKKVGLQLPSGEVVGEQTWDAGNLGTLLRDLAPMALTALTFGGGAAALGAAVAPTASATAQAAIGNALISGGTTALGGGKLEDVLKAAAVAGATPYVGQAIAPVAQSVSEAVGGGAAGQVAGSATAGALKSGIGALVSGQDPLEALAQGALTSGVTSGVGQVTGNYLGDLPDPIERAIGAAISSEILGGDTEKSVINSLISSARNAKPDMPGYGGDTGEEGFFAPGGEGYDSWGEQEQVFDPTFGGTLPMPQPDLYQPEFELPLLTDRAFMPHEIGNLETDFIVDQTGGIRDTAGNVGEFIQDVWQPRADPNDFIGGNLELDFVVDERGNVRDTAGNMGEFVGGQWTVRTDPRDFINPPPSLAPAPAPAALPAPTPAPAPAPAPKAPAPAPGGMDLRTLMAMMGAMGYKEDPEQAFVNAAQINVKSPFGSMPYGNMPYA